MLCTFSGVVAIPAGVLSSSAVHWGSEYCLSVCGRHWEEIKAGGGGRL